MGAHARITPLDIWMARGAVWEHTLPGKWLATADAIRGQCQDAPYCSILAWSFPHHLITLREFSMCFRTAAPEIRSQCFMHQETLSPCSRIKWSVTYYPAALNGERRYHSTDSSKPHQIILEMEASDLAHEHWGEKNLLPIYVSFCPDWPPMY